MKKMLHRAQERGVGEYGWLHARYSFSFASWYDPSRMGFGALRVINDDSVEPGAGFPQHGHRDMEIITIVTEGAVAHEDSMGNKYVVPAGDVQVMSAGAGVVHAEMNASDTEPLALFQVWIEPHSRGLAASYAQKAFGLSDATEGLELLVSPAGRAGTLAINQDAWISYGVWGAGARYEYRLRSSTHGLYVLVVEGEVAVAGEVLRRRDAVGIEEAESVVLVAQKPSKTLLFEVPMVW